MKKNHLSAQRIEQDLQEINRPAEDPRGGITRLSYSREHAEALRYLQRECHALGVHCFLDEAGNFAARIEGTQPELPPLLPGLSPGQRKKRGGTGRYRRGGNRP